MNRNWVVGNMISASIDQKQMFWLKYWKNGAKYSIRY
jgi:hypothetical protein